MKEYNKTEKVLVDLVVSQTKQTALTNAALMAIVAVILWPVYGAEKVSLWLFSGFVFVALRVYFFGKVSKGTLLKDNYPKRELWLAIGLAIAGIHWGLAGWYFLDPSNLTTYVALSTAILGVASGSVASTAPRPILWLVFVGTEFSLVTAKFISLDQFTIAVMGVLFTLGVYGMVKSVGKGIETSVTKDFINEELLIEVSKAKDLAEKANIEKSLFMAATSHDLRQPIHAQGLLLEALKGSNSSDNTLVEKLSASNAVLHGLFDSLLEISQLDSGTIKVNKSHQPIYDICSQVINDFELSAADKNLSLNLTGDKCTVLTDPILIGRILRNLVSNAIKYTNRGSVTINVSIQEGKAILSVIDTGIGIAATEHEMIFSEYIQLNNNSRDRHKGVGLGLALVKRMCMLLEYEVSVKSAPAEGATFTLQLPLGDARKVITVKESVSPVAIQDLDIVLVDDEQAILEAMKALLGQWKCRCHAFTTIEEAEQSIARKKYNVDIIISDYRLSNDMRGIDCIKRLRQVIDTESETPAVLISGDTDPKLLKQLQEGGFYMLHKPLKPSELRNVMAILLNE